MNCPFCNAIVPNGHTQCCFCGEMIPEVEEPQTAEEIHENESETGNVVQVIDAPSTEEAISADNMEMTEQKADSVSENSGAETADMVSENQQENDSQDIDDECLPQSTKNNTDESKGDEQKEKGVEKAPKKKKGWLLMVALFLCGVVVGALLLGGIDKNRTPQEMTSGKDASHAEIEPENKTEGIEEPGEQETDDDAENGTVVERIDEEFAGVWGKYYANDDGTLQYDENGEMIFTGDLVIIDPDNDAVYELYEDNTVSEKWIIRKTDKSDEFSFWADNGRFCYVRLVIEQGIREISLISETESINRVWFKIDDSVPGYDQWTVAASDAGDTSLENSSVQHSSLWDGMYNIYGAIGGGDYTWYDDASFSIDVGANTIYYQSGEYAYEYTIISVDDTMLKYASDEASDYVVELTRQSDGTLSRSVYATNADGTESELGKLLYVKQ